MTHAVELRDVFRIYAPDGVGVPALQGLTLDVRAGEVCVVLGPSGSGKSTLLRILAGLDRPSAGDVRVLGLDLTRLSPRALAAYRSASVGYAEQHYRRALAEELTARELVGLQPGLAGASARERAARADDLLERVGLADRRDARPGELSGGEQQRVAICAALAHRPRLFLADEPTGELDAANARAVYALIGRLVREERCTAVVVSHDPESAAIADRVVSVRDGRVSEEAARGGGDEAIVVARGGWIRLSEELLRRAGIAARAAARLDTGGIVVTPAGDRAPTQRAPVLPAERPLPLRPPPDGRAVAELRSVTKRHGPGEHAVTVLHDLSARFRAGRLYAVTGPSGSGKTTLLHLLGGLDVPTVGEVLIEGVELAALDRAGRAAERRRHVALVGQEPGLVPFLTARENVEVGLALRADSRGDEAARAAEALGAVGLTARSEQRADRLSAGERERVAVARAVAARPALLLADEPTARLDQANALSVAALLVRLAREESAAVVCATHDPLVIEQADEVLPLEGRAPVATPAEPAESPAAG